MEVLNKGSSIYHILDWFPSTLASIEIRETKEGLDILYSFWSGPFLDSLDFPWIHGDAMGEIT